MLKHDFSGEIAVYVLKSADEEDIPPASIDLYARKSREPFSFVWIMDKCGFNMRLEDADKIMFYGGEEHTLCVKNSGDATIFYGKDILLRNKKYPLNYNEKILLIFNNGGIELEIHYKNRKPSERKK